MEIKITRPKNLTKRIFSIIFRIIISTVILGLIISLIKLENVISAFQKSDPLFISLAALLLMANLGVRTLKWHNMLQSVKKVPSYYEAFSSVMLGISLGSFTPGEIGEFAGRSLLVNDAKRSHLVGLTFLDKAQIFIITAAIGVTCLTINLSTNPFLISGIGLVVIILALFILMRMNMLAAFGHRLNKTFFQKAWLTKVIDGFSLLTNKQLIETLILTLVFHFVIILQMYFLINAFNEISLWNAFVGTSSMLLVKSCLPISLGDLGIREASSIYLFSSYNISQAAALNASILLFFINVFIPSIIGTFFIRHQHISVKSYIELFKNNNNKQHNA